MKNITVTELKQRLDSGETINLIDVREDDERAAFNIGGVHHRLGKLQIMDVEDIEDLREQEVVCYCRAGARSMQACMILEQLGFTNTVNLEGGMNAWQEMAVHS